MRRDLGAYLTIALVVGAFTTFAWMTRHPDAEIIQRASGWPLVGPLVVRFREIYLPPPRPAIDEAAEEDDFATAVVRVPPPYVDAHEHVWALPGTALKAAPESTAATLFELTTIANLPKLERRGDWFRVWRDGIEGWVYLEGYEENRDPPLGMDPAPPLPLPGREPDAEQLRVARAILGAGERQERLGPYPLYTDVDDGELLAYLDGLATQLEEVYVGRYGQRPIDRPRASLVLYRGEGGYRLLQLRSQTLLGLRASGHNAAGVAAFYAGDRSPREIGSTLVHELVHLLNRRALGPFLPSWLDEGLCDDLAHAAVDAAGRIRPGELGGEREQQPDRVLLRGALAALDQLRYAVELGPVERGGVASIRDLMELDWNSFVRSDRSEQHYAQAAFWVRYLLDGEDGRWRQPFHDFLASIARGEPATAEALRQRLDESWQTLDARFRVWLVEGLERTR